MADPLTTDEITNSFSEADFPDRPESMPESEWLEARNVYREKVDKLESRWSQWLAKEHGHGLTPAQHEETYALAHSMGTYDGYEKQEEHYVVLAGFASRIIESN